MRGVVLDAWAVLALLRGERPAAEVVRRYVRRTADGHFEVLLNVVNLGEVLYRLIDVEGRAQVREIDGKPGAYQCTVYLRPHFQLDQLTAGIKLTTQLSTRASE